MARPTGGYHLKDGTRVPGVTTILGRFKDAGGLIHWAWEEGKEGRDYRETRDKAASIGHIVHDMVESAIHGRAFERSLHPPELLEKADVAFGAFERWREAVNLKVIETELPLVSETYRYGGTMDAMTVQEELAITDWKTSQNVYPEYLLQMAAYKQLWEENFPDRPVLGGCHLLRFDKNHGDFHHHYYSDLDTAWEAFKPMPALYEQLKVLKKRVG